MTLSADEAGPSRAKPPEINLSLTMSVLTPLTIGASSAARAGQSRVPVREETARRHGFLTVVCFGNFRGDADGGGGMRPGCEEVAPKAPLPRADTVCLALAMAIALLLPRSGRAQTPAPSLGGMASAGNTVSTASTANSGSTVGRAAISCSRRSGATRRCRRAFAGRRSHAARRRSAAARQFVAPTRIGATPIYGSPNGLGAGNTGYDSLNTPRQQEKEKVAARTRAGRTRSAGSGNHFHAGADVRSRRARICPPVQAIRRHP